MSLPHGHKGGDIACRVVFFCELALNCISLALMSRPRAFLSTFVPKKGTSSTEEHQERVDKLFGDGAHGFVHWVGNAAVVTSSLHNHV